MDLVFDNVMDYFLPRVGQLPVPDQKPRKINIDEIPLGVVQVYPDIIYTPNVQNSFDRLECARRKYTLQSEQRILHRTMSKEKEPSV